ncbi:MAG: Glu/Leu/Phe/Val dehydrogenase [Pseudomonadota bacterium]|nr:Glu/Leu/Phe/Val dehydrogenase [Pseudomonadota bacterium]
MDYKDLETDFLKNFDDYNGHERVRRFECKETGLIAFIAVHNTNLGPALGGCRMFPYETENDAIKDVLRLSRGMTYKNALAGLPLGGGKSVIIGNPHQQKTEALIKAMGRAVDTLNGSYITAEDSGTNVKDMMLMSEETDYVMGRKVENSDLGGDPSPYTAFGVFSGLKATCAAKFGSDDLSGKTVAVQGLGAVGYDLCRRLDAEGAKLIVTDIQQASLDRAVSEFKDVTVVEPDALFDADVDIFAPCAMGAAINAGTLPRLKASVIAGAANNQLATPAEEKGLEDKGILYAPDYAINAGGVIAVCYEYLHLSGSNPLGHELTMENMKSHISGIADTLARIFEIAENRGISTARAADELAERIFMGSEQARATA